MAQNLRTPSEYAPTTALVFFKFSETAIFHEMLENWGESDETRLLRAETADEAIHNIADADHALIACVIAKATQLRDFAQAATRIRDRVLNGSVEFAVINRLDHPNIPAILKNLGCSELLHASIKAKSFKAKLLKQLERQKSKNATESKGARSLTDVSRAQVAEKTQTGGAVQEIAALSIEDDCWITNPKNARRVNGNWVITLMGPGTAAGRWNPAGSDSWEWTAHQANVNPFVKAGRWIFVGRKPEFRAERWTFIGINAELRYVPDGTLPKDSQIFRFRLDHEGNLLLPANSSAAEAKIPLINESLELSIEIKKEAEKDVPDFLDLASDPSKLLELRQTPPPESQGIADFLTEKPLGSYLKKGFGSKKEIDPKQLEYLNKVAEKLRPRNGIFVPVDDSESQASYLSESSLDECPAIIWTPQQVFRKNTSITNILDSDGLIVKYPEGFDIESLKASLTNAGADRVFLNVLLRRSSLFFMQMLDQLDLREDGLRFPRPSTIFEVQRRKHFRHSFNPGPPFQVFVGHKEGNAISDARKVYSAVDLSAGGMCLRLREDAIRRFTPGDILPNLHFSIYNREIRCAGQVRWKRGSNFGIQFISIEPEEFDGVRLFVMEESSGYFRTRILKA